MRPTGAERIAAERLRQINTEGWTDTHDNHHDACEMAMAASAYIYWAVGEANGVCWPDDEPAVPSGWPWGAEWFKPGGDPVRALVKAGALIAAEIDRLQRALTVFENEASV